MMCCSQFDTYLSVAHGARRRRRGDKAAAEVARAAHDAAVKAAAGLEPVKAPLEPAEQTTTRWVPAQKNA